MLLVDGPGGDSSEVVCRRIRSGEIALLPPTVSAACRDLIAGMLEIDPSRRVAMQAVLAHPWVRAESRRLEDTKLMRTVVRTLLNFYWAILSATTCRVQPHYFGLKWRCMLQASLDCGEDVVWPEPIQAPPVAGLSLNDPMQTSMDLNDEPQLSYDEASEPHDIND